MTYPCQFILCWLYFRILKKVMRFLFFLLTRSKLVFDWISRSWAFAYIIQVTIWKRADFCSFLYFTKCKERLNSEAKIRQFSKYLIISKEKIREIRTFWVKSDAYQQYVSKNKQQYSDIAYPNTCCHNVLLLTMILTSAFMYFCNTGDFCPCVLTVAIAIK